MLELSVAFNASNTVHHRPDPRRRRGGRPAPPRRHRSPRRADGRRRRHRLAQRRRGPPRAARAGQPPPGPPRAQRRRRAAGGHRHRAALPAPGRPLAEVVGRAHLRAARLLGGRAHRLGRPGVPRPGRVLRHRRGRRREGDQGLGPRPAARPPRRRAGGRGRGRAIGLPGPPAARARAGRRHPRRRHRHHVVAAEPAVLRLGPDAPASSGRRCSAASTIESPTAHLLPLPRPAGPRCSWRSRGIRASRTGRALLALRDNERAPRPTGCRPCALRLTAFAISGASRPSAGACSSTTSRPSTTSRSAPGQNIVLFTMAVIGGLGSLTGAVLGAVYGSRGSAGSCPATGSSSLGRRRAVRPAGLPRRHRRPRSSGCATSGSGRVATQARPRRARRSPRPARPRPSTSDGPGARRRRGAGCATARCRTPAAGSRPMRPPAQRGCDSVVTGRHPSTRSSSCSASTPSTSSTAPPSASCCPRSATSSASTTRASSPSSACVSLRGPGPPGPDRRLRRPAPPGAPRLDRRRSPGACSRLLTGLASTLWFLGRRPGRLRHRQGGGGPHPQLAARRLLPARGARPRCTRSTAPPTRSVPFLGPLVAGFIAFAYGWRAPFFVFAMPTVIFVVLASG